MIQAHLNMGGGNSAESRPWKSLGEKGTWVPAKSLCWGSMQESRKEIYENKAKTRLGEAREHDQGSDTEVITHLSILFVTQMQREKTICVLLCCGIDS